MTADLVSIGHPESVELNRIDSTDQTYRITTRSDIEDLLPSLKAVGLLSPPMLAPASAEDGQNYIVVAGFRRIDACRQLGIDRIEVRILNLPTSADNAPDEAAIDDFRLKCAQLAIADNAMQRPLNLIEQARCVALLSTVRHHPVSLMKTASAVMGIPENPSLLKKLLQLHDLPDSLQTLVLTDCIALATALELAEFERETGLAFSDYFRTLKLSFSNQKELMTQVREIALRENITPLDVLNTPGLRSVLNDTDSNRNQKTQAVRRSLKLRRFPALTRAEAAFQKEVKALKLDPDTRLVPPKYFEGRVYSLTMNFRNMNELERRRDLLERMVSHPSMKRILSQE